jgi:leucyl aminopeptidase
MPGMKADCGGAAAILGAFKAAVKQVTILRQSQNNFLKQL